MASSLASMTSSRRRLVLMTTGACVRVRYVFRGMGSALRWCAGGETWLWLVIVRTTVELPGYRSRAPSYGLTGAAFPSCQQACHRPTPLHLGRCRRLPEGHHGSFYRVAQRTAFPYLVANQPLPCRVAEPQCSAGVAGSLSPHENVRVRRGDLVIPPTSPAAE